MDRYTQLTGVHTTDAGRIRTLQSDDNSRFYIELEFFSPVKVVELAELCKSGDLYLYAHGLISRLEPESSVFRSTHREGGGEMQLDDPSLVLSEEELWPE